MFENWEQGTRNASGAKVRTYESGAPRLRKSMPHYGYTPFQYAKSFGSQSGTGLRLVPDCKPAKVKTGGYIGVGSAGRKLPTDISRAIVIIKTGASTKNQIKAFVNAVDALYSFLEADANAKAENLVRRYRIIYQNAEKRRGVWDMLHNKSYTYSNVNRYAIEEERYSAQLIRMLLNAVAISGYAMN